jgi:branched-chain amino acid transport system substrate-binding protein
MLTPAKIYRPLIIAVSMLTVLAATVFSGGCKNEGPTDYLFGVVAPFSGQEGASLYGKNIKQAVELALSEINARGGMNGRKMAAVYEDDQLQASVAVGAVQKLISGGRISVVIGPVASSSTIAASKVAEQNHTILISPSSTANNISGMSPWVFRTIAPDNFEAEKMVRYARAKGYHRIGIAYVDNAGTKGPAAVFRNTFDSQDSHVVAFEEIPQGVTDVRVQVSKLAKSKPDAVYLLGYALELGAMIKQFREQDKMTPILSFQVMEEPKVREIAGDAAEGVIFTTPTIYGNFATGRQKAFIAAYHSRYGEEPGIFAANAYDAVFILEEVVKKYGSTPEKIRDGLRQVRGFDGASGRFDINDKGDSNQEPRLMYIKKGKIELAE